MPVTNVENNFTKGLVTEYTGLNFPENAATDTNNCDYSLIGDVSRRQGIDKEINGSAINYFGTTQAIQTYKWNNAGGDGSSQILVAQLGATLVFWLASAATAAVPLSGRGLASTVVVSNFVANGATFNVNSECQFTDGNGYLFVFHPDCDPIYCTYGGGVITGNRITTKIRDFVGVPETGVPDNTRPSVINDSHLYNLQNQGWTSQNPWSAVSTSSVTLTPGSKNFTVSAGIVGITVSQYVLVQARQNGLNVSIWGYGNVTSYVGTTLTINVTGFTNSLGFTIWTDPIKSGGDWLITPVSTGYLTTFVTALGVYPSNADQWWRFKTVTNVFDPGTTNANISIGLGAAPKGHYILDAFDQQRDQASGVLTITDITTTKRPTNGCWFLGRLWQTGVNASQVATGTAPFTTWSENIYFSQVTQKTDDFGKCYQVNDPTTEELFDLLPTDGGVITIQGSGPIYKLFPIQNGLLVFAGNGIWFITGSQGIGFSANDYTLTKISSIQSISSNSFINVQGLPYFWNEEGIYTVTPAQGGGLTVQPITYDTILTYYQQIPLSSKKFVRGDYNPLNYVIQWAYRSTEATTTAQTYSYDKILNFNTVSKAFFPYTVSTSTSRIAGLNYVAGVGGTTTTSPAIKYFTVTPSGVTFSEEYDTSYLDWTSTGTPVDYSSTFTTGYKVHGDGQRRFQMPYVYVYCRTNDETAAFRVQGIWDYATSGNTGRWSTAQVYYIEKDGYSVVPRRIRIRGQGLALQIRFQSMTGLPFDFIGWSVFETQNKSV